MLNASGFILPSRMWLFLYGTFSKWTRSYEVPCLQNSPVTLIPTFWRLLSFFFLWLLTFQEFVTYSVPFRKNTVVWHPYQGKLTINFDSHLRGGNVNCTLIKPKSTMSLNGFPESLPLFNWCMGSPPINGGSDSGKTFGFQLLGLLALLQVKLLWRVQLGIKQNIML